MNRKLEFIKTLTDAAGAPGFEDQVVEVIREYVGHALIIEEDKMRNLVLRTKHFDPEKPIVMLDGHSDEVAFMVQSVQQNGMLRFLALGGWFSQNVGAHKVKVKNSQGDYITGIVSSKPPHFMTEAERAKIVQISEMTIDVGSTSYEETVEIYKIEPGAPIVPAVAFEYVEQTQMMIGKAFDNRLGCGLVVETMLALQDEVMDVNVLGAISAQEEVGTRGSRMTVQCIKPDVAIVFEGSPADDPYRGPYERQGALRSGTQIRHRDNSMVGNPRFIQFARTLAKANGHRFQDAIRLGGGTDAGAIHLSHQAVPTLVFGVPVRYAHTHYGISNFTDYETTLNFSVDLIKSLNRNIIDKL